MERIIFKYSDFFQDDGAFEEALKKVDDFGDKIVASAKKTQSEFKKALDLDNVEAIASYEKQAEKLTEQLSKQQKARKSLTDIEEQYNKTIKKSTDSTEEQVKRLVGLDKELQNYRSKLKEINDIQKKGVKTDRDLNKEKVETEIAIKAVRKEINLEQKAILKKNELTTKERKLAEAMAVLRKEEVETRGEIKERIAALNVAIDNTNIKTEEGRKIVADYITEQDALRKKLGEVSDEYTRNKINIGNYEESIVNALKSVNLFQGELSFLNGFVEKGIDFFTQSGKSTEKSSKTTEKNTKVVKENTKEVKENTKAKEENKKATDKNIDSTEKSTEETKKAEKGTKRFGKALKGLALVGVISLLASLASVFGQGRAGAIATAKATARLQAVLKTLVDVGAEVGKGLLKIFVSIGRSFSSFFDSIDLFVLKAKQGFLELTNAFGRNDEAIRKVAKEIKTLQEEISQNKETEYAEGWNQITEAIGGAGKQIDEATKSIATLDKAAIRAFQIADEIKKAELALIGLRKEVALLEIKSEDSTRSLKSQLEATDELLVKRVELLTKEGDVARKNLELANAKARADAERAGFNLAKDEVAFAEQLLDLNIRLSEERGENNLDDTFLEESQTALREYKAALNEIEIAEKETAKTRREIQRDLFEQNLDLLIDLIDTEKNLSEQFVNDTTRNFESRIKEFNDFIIKFRQNTQRELEEFNKQAENLGLDLDFNIQYDEDGNFEVFIGDTKLATDNIIELNEQLQNTGLGEIEINRFREFLVETRNGVKDFKELNSELTKTGIEVSKLREDVSVSDDELNALRELDERIFELRKKANGRISGTERKSILKQLTELEKEKTSITEFAGDQRLQNQLQAIDDELKIVEEGSERYYELLEERNSIEKELLDKSVKEQIDSEKEKQKKIIAARKKAAEETRAIINKVLDAVVEAQQKQVEKAEEATDKQKELVDKQQERAQAGLANTLAFEQRELGKREAERIKEEQKQQRLEKIKALYSSYSNYASQGDGDNAIVKALRDFAILEAIQASFGDGGIVEDKIPTDGKGIIRGRSHQGRFGGIPILVEGKEGIFSSREMENLGKDNFYKMKEIASLGKVDSNFFGKQGKSLATNTIMTSYVSPELVEEMREVKKAIQSKPSSSWDVRKVFDGTIELIETIRTKNHVKRNIHKVRKPRL